MSKIAVSNNNGLISFQINEEFEDNQSISLNYIGEGELTDTELKKAELILNRLFGDLGCVPYVEKVVHHVKTIFRKVEEKELSVRTSDIDYEGNQEDTYVAYNDGKLFMYSVQKDSPVGRVGYEYLRNGGIRYNCMDKDMFDMSYDESKDFDHFVSWENGKVNDYRNNVKAPVGDRKDFFPYELKTMCSAYKVFYKENPDFSKYETRLKAQAMIMILFKHGYNVAGLDSGFTSYGSLPYNSDFSEYCYTLEPYGELKPCDFDGNHFGSKELRVISDVGKLVQGLIKNSGVDEEECMKNLITVFYAKDRVFRQDKGNDPKSYQEKYAIDEQEASKCLGLIKKMKINR